LALLAQNPTQILEEQPDGGLIVRFWASGHAGNVAYRARLVVGRWMDGKAGFCFSHTSRRNKISLLIGAGPAADDSPECCPSNLIYSAASL
jgi:hypothetical protein